MTAQPHGPASAPVPERTPKAIRAALSPQDREVFDREFRAAMAQATDELDLAPVWACMDYWRQLAMLKATGAHERILLDAARIQDQAARGELPQRRPWREVMAELGVDV